MSKYLENFNIGKITLPNNIFCAPLSGCSDFSFRMLASEYSPGLMFCEMVKMEALIRKDPGTMKMLKYSEKMRPIGAQLFGSNPKIAKESAKILEDLGFDVIDFNCGCPVKKVVKDGSGAKMLLNRDLIGEILSNIIDAVSVPVTIKIRTGWDNDNIFAVDITKLAESLGASAITIHGRTRAQGYSGKADWNIIKACKAEAKSIKVIGNGDIMTAKDAIENLRLTNCDGIMLARGLLHSPWLIEDIKREANNFLALQHSFSDIKKVLLKHYSYILENQSSNRALFDFRRVGFWYLKNFHGAKKLRIALYEAQSTEEAIDILSKEI